jgi:hypothetical protein
LNPAPEVLRYDATDLMIVILAELDVEVSEVRKESISIPSQAGLPFLDYQSTISWDTEYPNRKGTRDTSMIEEFTLAASESWQ